MLHVKDIMITDVYTVHRDDVVQTVLDKFVEFRISGMPIVDNDKHLVGYISDGDIMRFLGKHVGDPMNSWVAALGSYYGITVTATEAELARVDELRENALAVCQKTANQVGNKRVITVDEDDNLVDVADLLSRRKIKKVPVVRDGALVGIVSRGDVVRAVVQKVLKAGQNQAQ